MKTLTNLEHPVRQELARAQGWADSTSYASLSVRQRGAALGNAWPLAVSTAIMKEGGSGSLCASVGSNLTFFHPGAVHGDALADLKAKARKQKKCVASVM